MQQESFMNEGTVNLWDQCLYVATKDSTINTTTRLHRIIVVALIRVGPFFFLLWTSRAWGFILAMNYYLDHPFFLQDAIYADTTC